MTRTDHVQLAVDDGTDMRAFVARPDGPGPHPGILVLQEAYGVNANIREITQRWAAQGYVAVAPELFHRAAPGFEVDAADITVIMPLIKSLTTEGLVADARAAHAWLLAEPDVDGGRVAAVGFCMGGRAAFLANSALPLAACISYYGGAIAPALLDRAPLLHGPQLFFWGGRDRNIPPEQHRAVVDAVRAAGKPFVDVEFSEAQHGFFNDRVERHDPSAAAESWALSIAFLQRVLGVS
jgi:carboxymethylenebutenolidase